MEFITFSTGEEPNYTNKLSPGSDINREPWVDSTGIIHDKSGPRGEYLAWTEYLDSAYSQVSLDPAFKECFDDTSESGTINSDTGHSSSVASSSSSTSLGLPSKFSAPPLCENTSNYSYSYPDLPKHFWNENSTASFEAYPKSLDSSELSSFKDDLTSLDFLFELESSVASRSGSISLDEHIKSPTVSDLSVLQSGPFSNLAPVIENADIFYGSNMDNNSGVESITVNETDLPPDMYPYFKNTSESSLKTLDTQISPLTNPEMIVLNQHEISKTNDIGFSPKFEETTGSQRYSQELQLTEQKPFFSNNISIETTDPYQSHTAGPIVSENILPRRRSEVRLSKVDLYTRMGLSNNHSEARAREDRIFDILKRTGYDLGTQTWIRDTNEKKRREIIDLIFRSTFEEYGYKKDLLELIVRRGSYCLTQGRLRRIRRYKKANQMRELGLPAARGGGSNKVPLLNKP
ncbi:hypothetical protein NADFUDRAFT_49948 [Nadsonia fulvescens var. elongata DSM 6958]|uniref:Uncharacterized protein n=1 Tax=Nadsonia fulvescens var. elongata DSM 6958 TaxID=857566 RepID=A0A1E3PQD4_9ASCO|nr:hypothetical protein NADFUDRAFT_49948 [Nadsonia fulvescens var. elongata DSM 6958]